MTDECLARTDAARPPCPTWDDGAHHCRDVSEPPRDYAHTCRCGYRWTSLSGTVGELWDLMKPLWRQMRPVDTTEGP